MIFHDSKDMISFRLADINDLEEISALCADAFLDYDFYRPFVADPVKRLKFVYDLHVQCFKAEIRRKQAVVGIEDGKIVTAFALHDPESRQPGLWEYLTSGALSMIFRYGFAPISWFSMYDKCSAPVTRFNKEHQDVYYVEVLAVRQDKQRQGIGSRAIHEYMVPFVRSSGGGFISLITNSEENTLFYEANGFKCFDHKKVPAAKEEIGNWCFSMNV